jgi:hypothetical protein
MLFAIRFQKKCLFFLCEHDVKGRSGKLYSGINILSLSLSLFLSLRAEWWKGDERKMHFASHCNKLPD